MISSTLKKSYTDGVRENLLASTIRAYVTHCTAFTYGIPFHKTLLVIPHLHLCSCDPSLPTVQPAAACSSTAGGRTLDLVKKEGGLTTYFQLSVHAPPGLRSYKLSCCLILWPILWSLRTSVCIETTATKSHQSLTPQPTLQYPQQCRCSGCFSSADQWGWR